MTDPTGPAPSIAPTPAPSRAQADPAALSRLVDAADSTCTLVLRGDEVVYEHPAGSREQARPVYSITKSVVALLTVIAVEEGLLRLDDPVAEHVTGWPASSAAVTVRQLLSMTSGRHWSEELDDAMIGARDQTAAALAVGQTDPPGSAWRYDNLAAQALSPALESAVGDLESFARGRLFDPLGLVDTSWRRDGTGRLTTYAGLASSCRDLARLGALMRDGGEFAGRTIVSADGVAELIAPSSAHNAAYGLLWWGNSAGRIVEVRRAAGFAQDREPYEGRLAPRVPADAFWALGWGSQLLAVVPSADLVAVRLGRKPASADDLTFDSFTAAAIAATG